MHQPINENDLETGNKKCNIIINTLDVSTIICLALVSTNMTPIRFPTTLNITKVPQAE
jgi:hypothetical protein